MNVVKNFYNNKPVLALIIVFFIASFSIFFFPGYSVVKGDQVIYLASVFEKINNISFDRDILSFFNQSSYTIFDDFLIKSVKYFNIDIFTLLLALSFLIRFVYFYSIYRISVHFTSNLGISIFVVLLTMAGLNVYGTESRTMEIEMVPRMISVSISLLALAFTLNKKKFIPEIILSVSLLFHVISTLPFLAIFYLFKLFKEKEQNNNYFYYIFLILPLFSLVTFTALTKSGGGEMFSLIDSSWENIIKIRDPYVYISSWNVNSFLYFLVSVGIWFIVLLEHKDFIQNRNRDTQILLSLLFFVPFIFFLISFIGADVLNFSLITQLQLSRALLIWKIFANMFFSLFLFGYFKKNPEEKSSFFFAIGLLFSFLFKEAFIFVFFPPFFFGWVLRTFNNKPHNFNGRVVSTIVFIFTLSITFLILLRRNNIYELMCLFGFLIVIFLISYLYPSLLERKKILIPFCLSGFFIVSLFNSQMSFSYKPINFSDKSYMEMCRWVKDNTKTGSLFIVEPFAENADVFRLLCLRNVFVSDADGGQVVFNRNYAFEWNRRTNSSMAAIKDNSLLIDMAEEDGIDYVVSKTSLNIKKPVLFNNSNYYIYGLRE